MEVPVELKKLYKHWNFHAQRSTNFAKNDLSENPLVKEIDDFATERMLVWERKYGRQEKPYTKDPILSKYRFCNIYRELDRQTIEIHSNIREFAEDFDIWLLNLAFQRFICRPETIEQIGYLSFDQKKNQTVYDNLMDLSSPKYGVAYLFPVSLIQKTEYDTRERFFCFYLPKIMKKVSKVIDGFDNVSVNEALSKILPVFGYNFRFHWTEILIDVAYQYPAKIDLFRDFYIGPGARPTLQRLSDDVDILDQLVNVKLKKFPYLQYEGHPIHLSAENWEGIACEFRKYSNLKKGTGRKRLYR